MSRKILLVDDHQIVIDGLKAMLLTESDFDVIHTANDPKSALKMIEVVHYDLIVSDLDMPEMNGLDFLKELRKQHDTRFLILSMHAEKSTLENAIELGTNGFVLKDADKHDLLFAINSIVAGKSFFSPQFYQKVESHENKPRNSVALSDRETEILVLIAEGLSNKQVAEQLFLSPKTVDNHRSNLMKKIGVHNVVGLVRYAFKHKIIQS